MKTIVKHWIGTSKDSSDAEFIEFGTKKEAEKYIKQMRRYHGRELMGISNFYEIVQPEYDN